MGVTATKRIPFAFPAGFLLLALAGLTLLSVELLQRRRFAVVERVIPSALREFQAKAARPFAVIPRRDPAYGSRSLQWVVSPPGGKGPDGTTDSFEVVLHQPRGLVLGSPRVIVFWKTSRDPKVEALADAILEAHGLTVDRGVWED